MKKKIEGALSKGVCPLCAAEPDEPVSNTKKSSRKKLAYMDEPCKKCTSLMDKGFLLIGIIEEKTEDLDNPWRSGHQWVITNEKASQIFDDDVKPNSAAFIDIKMAKALGLPVIDLTPKAQA